MHQEGKLCSAAELRRREAAPLVAMCVLCTADDKSGSCCVGVRRRAFVRAHGRTPQLPPQFAPSKSYMRVFAQCCSAVFSAGCERSGRGVRGLQKVKKCLPSCRAPADRFRSHVAQSGTWWAQAASRLERTIRLWSARGEDACARLALLLCRLALDSAGHEARAPRAAQLALRSKAYRTEILTQNHNAPSHSCD